MATFRLQFFSQPATLRAIEPKRLIAFLSPFRDFLFSRGVDIPVGEAEPAIDYAQLISVFMTPDSSVPNELLDALFLVDEMSTPEGMESLLQAANENGNRFQADVNHSAADIAVQIWLLNRELLERKHAEQFLSRPKSFEYYNATASELAAPLEATPANRAKLVKQLNDWFEEHHRGRSVKIFEFPLEHEIRFLVRHGEPYKREESLSANDATSVCFQPLKYDVLTFDKSLMELRINAQLVGEKKLYRQAFGLYLFGNEEFFPGVSKYTLEPLREFGPDALACGDIDGIDSIRLTEVDLFWGGAHREIEVRKSDHVFASLSDRGRELPRSPRIIKAVFKVKFSDAKTPRTVTIRPSNIAQYVRDGDAAVIERWLQLRGFIVSAQAIRNEPASSALAGA